MSQPSQFALLAQRRFGPFFWTQFLGAFNDNVFKTALVTILTYDALSWTALDIGLLNNLIPGLFILPFMLFSATAGQAADKFDKARLARVVKLLEIGIMAVAAVGWFAHQLWLLIAAVAGMGLHSTLFGPVKYAYLPQHLKANELVGGNGVVEMGTFVGILLGEILGALLVAQRPWGIELVAGGTIVVAVAGWLASRRIPASPAPAPELGINWNPLTETAHNLGFTRRNRLVFLAVLGNSWFWFYGAIVLAQFPVYARDYLHGDHGVFVLLLTVFSLGIGAGSLLCETLSGRKVEIGLVPLGSIGLTVFGFDLYLASVAYAGAAHTGVAGFLEERGSLRILFDCVMIGVFGGFYIVPLFALIQTRCDRKHVSRTIAGMNIMNALFMVAAALAAMAMLHAGFTIPQIFMAVALLNALVAIYLFIRAPEFPVRFLAWLLIHTSHRTSVMGADRIPEQGPALLVCNRISGLEALAVMAACPRPLRFVPDRAVPGGSILSRMFSAADAIPASSEKSAGAAIAQALDAGELVCMFSEGGDSMAGDDADIRKVIDRLQAPVIPIALRGSRFRLTLAVGEPISPADVDLGLLRERTRISRSDGQ